MTRVPSLVSVVVPAYNAESYVAQAVSSALAQTYQAIEVIVTNDGSSDRTADILSTFGARIRVIHQANAGLPSARNAGVAVASGEYIAFLDADDFWDPRKIERQIASIRALSDCGVVHTGVSFVDAEGNAATRESRPWHANPFQGRCRQELIEHNTIIVSSALVRAELLPDQPFRQFRSCEDWDLWLRLSGVTSVTYVDERLTYYRLHQSNMSSNAARMMEASIAVLEAFSRESRDPGLQAVARMERKKQCLALANYHFDRGDYSVARSCFGVAGWPMNTSDMARWLTSWFPPPVIGPARRIVQTFRSH